jgi:hypothetical protein
MKMKTQFRVINRVSRKEQLFNTEELREFFRYRNDVCFLRIGQRPNEWKDYAISVVKTEDNLDKVINVYLISLIAICSVVLITNIILQWI